MANPLDIARTVLGKAEGRDRAVLTDYLRTGGANLDPATAAWCAAFVNATLGQAGVSGTGSNMARSFMKWGSGVSDPQPGDIAVYPRGDPKGPYGHVGFVDSVSDGMVNVLAGNQGNAVSVKQYPLDAALGYRRGGAPMAEPQASQSGQTPGLPPMMPATQQGPGISSYMQGIFGIAQGGGSDWMENKSYSADALLGDMLAGHSPLRRLLYQKVMGLFA